MLKLGNQCISLKSKIPFFPKIFILCFKNVYNWIASRLVMSLIELVLLILWSRFLAIIFTNTLLKGNFEIAPALPKCASGPRPWPWTQTPAHTVWVMLSSYVFVRASVSSLWNGVNDSTSQGFVTIEMSSAWWVLYGSVWCDNHLLRHSW